MCALAQADMLMKDCAVTKAVPHGTVYQVGKPVSPDSSRQSGVTLIELIITIVVIGIAMSALVSSLSTGIANSSTPLWEGKALELSQAYLDEIQAMKFDEDTALGGGELSGASVHCTVASFDDSEVRSLFDDVDDYHNLTDAPPQLIDSAINMDEYANYSVSVQVACAGTDLGLVNNSSAKRITVLVSVPGGELRSVSFYKGNF
jgi:MSHA pilin protein MshD